VSLQTPIKLQRLQRVLYSKAKQESDCRFHFLYDKVMRMDVLSYAYAQSRRNGGAPGVDGQTFADIEAYGVKRWLDEIQEELRGGRYRPKPVRRVMIPKTGGVGERPLGIPTVRDRVVQTAVKLVVESIFEADFDDCAYGYRPKRSAEQAVKCVHEALWQNHSDVIDADVSKYFDNIPHAELMKSVARRVSDRRMLGLIKLWLKAPVAVEDERGNWHLEGGKKTARGTPQGGVLSPVLANIYMHRFIKAFRKHGLDQKYGAVLVNYADDFVVLCRHDAGAALAIIRRWFAKMGLELNDRKTAVRNAREESFDFLGYTFKMLRSYKTGALYPGATPAGKAVQRFKEEVRRWLYRQNVRPMEEIVATLNMKLRGWATYFRYGSVLRVRRKLDRFVYDRVRNFLRRRHQVTTRGTRRWRWDYVFGELGVVSLNTLPRVA
jgi:RNA-directed DNA polymerase